VRPGRSTCRLRLRCAGFTGLQVLHSKFGDDAKAQCRLPGRYRLRPRGWWRSGLYLEGRCVERKPVPSAGGLAAWADLCLQAPFSIAVVGLAMASAKEPGSMQNLANPAAAAATAPACRSDDIELESTAAAKTCT